jgi:hypothetical protein
MRDKTKIKRSDSELFDWMLAIDFNPGLVQINQKTAVSIIEILFL